MMQMHTGILGYLDWTPEQKAEAARQCEVERQREAAAAEWQIELRRRCAEIDAMAGKYMRPQLERQRPVVRPIDLARFKELQQFCADNGWPTSLPIMPHALCEHLSSVSGGYKHLLAITRSISKIHAAAGEDACPTRDPLVRAYIDLVRDDEDSNSKKGITE